MIINIIFKAGRKIISTIILILEKPFIHILLKGNNVCYGKFSSAGIPYVMVARGGEMKIGENFSMNNGIKGNPIGSYRKCTFFVDNKARLIIGNDVGISQTALICHTGITIGNRVKIGGGVSIYDTDFHSLDPIIRSDKNDLLFKKKLPVFIDDNVFIGAHSIILKGVTIGRNSIIGAGSLVTKSVPPNQIWAGNPAKFIRNL